LELDAKIYVAGHTGLVGSAIVRCLKKSGYSNIIERTHLQLDLTNQGEVYKFFDEQRPEYVFIAAAKVGGIGANISFPADFIRENMLIECNLIQNSYTFKVKKLIFLGSSCIYPKACPQPIKEEYLLSGYIEPTNEAYALAKICGIKMCQAYNGQYGTNFISVIPNNIYGPKDNYDLQSSHVIAALIKKIHSAKAEKKRKVEIWGSGKPLREFLYVDDAAQACLFIMNNYKGSQFINIGSSQEISISQCASLIKKIIGYEGEFVFDSSKSDGVSRKLLDTTRIQALGWESQWKLEEGLKETYKAFTQNQV
jgi:GDP-L-fucose synthase